MSDEMIDAIANLSPMEQIGMDVDRKWVTGVQVTVNPDFTLFVFREQTTLNVELEGQPISNHKLIKNITSVVMPTSVARELAEILSTQVRVLDAGA